MTDRQAAYQTDLRGQRGNTNITLPANAQYWSKEKIQPSSDPTKRTSSLQNEFGGRNGNQPTNHIFSFQDPKAGQQYRHIQTDSANPRNVTVNGRPLSEMTPKFTDPESRNQGSAPLRFSTPGMGLQNGPSAIDSQL